MDELGAMHGITPVTCWSPVSRRSKEAIIKVWRLPYLNFSTAADPINDDESPPIFINNLQEEIDDSNERYHDILVTRNATLRISWAVDSPPYGHSRLVIRRSCSQSY